MLIEKQRQLIAKLPKKIFVYRAWIIGILIFAMAYGSIAEAREKVENSANTYYVANQGDDNAGGRTRETAFRTIRRALESIQPGDTLLILTGAYPETVQLEGVGNSHGPITIRGQNSTTILDGQGRMALGFWCDDCTNFIIENLTIHHYTDIGIGVYLSADIVMRNLTVYNNGFKAQLADWEIEGYGIHVDESQRVIVEYNEIYQNGPQPKTLENLMGTGINTYGCTDCVIRNNRSHDNVGGGILVEDGVNVVVEGNEVYANDLDASIDAWWDGGIWIDGGHDVIVRKNIFRDNLGPGIQISDEDDQHPYGYLVEHNVSTRNYYGLYLWNFGTSDFPPEHILSLSNNQIHGNSRKDLWVVP